MSESEVQRRFLGWGAPLVKLAAQRLAGLSAEQTLDLRGYLLLLPTRQAARLLRRSLMQELAANGRSMLSGKILTAQQFVSVGDAVASRMDELLAWSQVLQAVSLDSIRALFPEDPPQRDFLWSTGTATTLMQLRDSLAEVGMDFAGYAGNTEVPESERRQGLVVLEKEYRSLLSAKAMVDSNDAKTEFSRKPEPPLGIHTIILMGHPDPMGLAVKALESLATQLQIEVWCYAPDEHREGFDAWGRPVTGYWTEELMIDNPEQVIHWTTDTAAQAQRAVELAVKHSQPEHTCVIASMDPDLPHELDACAAREKLKMYHPDGLSLNGHDWLVCLRGWHRILRSGRFHDLAEWLRQNAAIRCLSAAGYGGSAWQLRRALDEVQERHMPYSLEDLENILSRNKPSLQPLQDAILLVREWLDRLCDGEQFVSSCEQLFETWFGRPVDDPAGAAALEVIGDHLLQALDQLRRCPFVAQHNKEELWGLLLEQLKGIRMPVADPGDAITVSGWLELLWDARPHIILTGCNDGNWPSRPVADGFLTDSVRQKLGLPCEASRLERDAYLLRCLLESRSGDRGRVDFVGSAFNRAGDVLRPSTLLLLNDVESMPQRVRYLFAEPSPEQAGPAWTLGWRYRVQNPALSSLTQVNVTDFAAWLNCPWRLYLERRLRMRIYDPARRELDDADFGSVVHRVWELFLRDPAAVDVIEPSAISGKLEQRLDQVMYERFGTDLSTPLLIQRENALARLHAAAEPWALQRQEGWVPYAVEWKLHEENPPLLEGIPLHGKIDLIMVNTREEALRIIDFKTRDKAHYPIDAHITKAGKNPPEHVPPEAFLEDESMRWTDLQLPLYAWALRERGIWHGQPLSLGYFNLPTVISQTGFYEWEGFSRDLEDRALSCARAIVERMQQGIYQPHNPRTKWRDDPMTEWFMGDWNECFELVNGGES
jgi:ATP-dependent helicase/nuclease subunit B